ncbi:MAG: ATP-dependent helicase [Dissulfurispiraceae bacterium]
MITDGLNKQQKEAVEHFGSPLLVLAGAGSGKTKVITTKIAWLIKEKGIKPNRILAITFTKKAAREMQERVERLLSVKPKWISTFHSFCVRVLRENIASLERNYDKNFAIYDEHDSMKVIKDILREGGLDVKHADAARGVISKAKQDYRGDIVDYIASLPYPMSGFAPVAAQYLGEMEKSNALDYDDIIYLAVDLLSRKPELRKHWQERFDYILVDEYQDTNKIQYLLINLLVSENGDICVVGDPQQCIYTWRGAHPLNILNFTKDFSATETKLEKNYRSTKKILSVANKVIAKADMMWEGRILQLSTDRRDDGEVIYTKNSDNIAECSNIASKIRKLTDIGYQYSDIAVLMRMSFVSRGFEHTFMNSGIPYDIIGGAAFYERAEVKDLLAYLRLMLNRKDRAAFERSINAPTRSIGIKTLANIRECFTDDWIQALRDTNLPPRQRSSADRFSALIESHSSTVNDSPHTVLMELLKDIRYEEYLSMHYKDDFEERQGNVSELANVLKALELEGKPFSQFIEDTILASEQDKIGPSDSVKVLTIHAAKGLEFPVVFVVALEEAIFPSARSLENYQALEEERRLFYVAVTRAKERLYLSSASYRKRYGDAIYATRSRYIEEIKEDIPMVQNISY